MATQRAIRHHAYGKPEEVLRLETVDVPEPGPREARVRLLAAAVNPSDCGMIAGSYARLRDLPAVAGREGVGVVDAVGAEAGSLAEGQRVRFPGDDGAWREYACAPAESLIPAPEGVPDAQAAVSFVNPPTALCLLREFVELGAGAWVVQNAANSAVGLSVIQLAREMGARTLNQVRREEVVGDLKKRGADAVVTEGSDWPERLDELTGGVRPALALNSVGGPSATDQIKSLAEGGVHVTFGGMVGDPVRFPTRHLIFNDVRLVGFWWDRWSRAHPEKAAATVGEIHERMADGRLEIPIEAEYSFDDYAEALAHAGRPRMGKILLRP